MGQTLSEPIVEKHSSDGSDARFQYGASAMQGWRTSMEDAHTTELNLLKTTSPTTTSQKLFSFFAVYDGHGGRSVSKYAGDYLHGKIVNTDEFEKEQFEAAVTKGFLSIDVDCKTSLVFLYLGAEYLADPSGCTAVTILVTPEGKIICGNAGDSRAILSSNGNVIPLSFDHKPNDPIELERIKAAGGYVEFERVNGNLALSRAIGDYEFKKNEDIPAEQQIVTVNPDIITHQITSIDEFIVLACDGFFKLISGIWDVKSNAEVIQFVTEYIATHSVEKLSTVCEALMDACLAPFCDMGGLGCDNMTVVIVAILHGGSFADWCERIKKRHESGIVDTAEESVL